MNGPTAADQFDDTPSPTDLQQFVYLANNVFEFRSELPVLACRP
jgi:hypothetical protein